MVAYADIGAGGVVVDSNNSSIEIRTVAGKLRKFDYAQKVEITLNGEKSSVDKILKNDRVVLYLTKTAKTDWLVYKVNAKR